MSTGKAELGWAMSGKQNSACMLNFISIFIVYCNLIPTTEQLWKCQITLMAKGGSGWNTVSAAAEQGVLG